MAVFLLLPMQIWALSENGSCALIRFKFYSRGLLFHSSLGSIPLSGFFGMWLKTMDYAKLGLFLVLVLGLADFISCKRPAVVNIGAVLSYDSVIGRVTRPAIEAAVADVNSDKNILDGTRLNLIMESANCNAFLGAVGGRFFWLISNIIVLDDKSKLQYCFGF